MLAAHIQHARRRRIGPDGLRRQMEPVCGLCDMLCDKAAQRFSAACMAAPTSVEQQSELARGGEEP